MADLTPGRFARRLVGLSFVVGLLAPAAAHAVKLYGAMTVTGDFTPGGSVAYQIVLSHEVLDSQSDNPGDEFRDVLPSGVTLVSAAASSGTTVASLASNQVSWNGAIPPQQTVTITIYATINAAVGTTVSNQGSLSFSDPGGAINNVIRLTDDPGTAAVDDATVFVVAPDPVCGDGVVEAPEVCDGGPLGSPCCLGGCTTRADDGTGCGDGDPCNGAEVCAAGACTAGTPVVCETCAACDAGSGLCEAIPGCGDPEAEDAPEAADAVEVVEAVEAVEVVETVEVETADTVVAEPVDGAETAEAGAEVVVRSEGDDGCGAGGPGGLGLVGAALALVWRGAVRGRTRRPA